MTSQPEPSQPHPARNNRSGDSADGVKDIAALMNALDPLERTALHMVYRQRLTQNEIAQELRVPISAVRAAVARGMRHLASLIAAQ